MIAALALLTASEALFSQRLVELTALSDSVNKYDFVGEFYCNRVLVESGEKSGFIDTTGRLVIDTVYDGSHCLKFTNGFCAVSKDEKYGIIDSLGRVVVPFQYENIAIGDDDMAVLVDSNKKYSLFDLRKMRLIPMHKYKRVGMFRCGRVTVIANRYSGYADRDGNLIIKGRFRWINGIRDSVAKVTSRKLERYDIDMFGNRLNIKYKMWSYFEKGVALFGIDNKCGVIDKNGRVIIEPKYDREVSVSIDDDLINLENDITFVFVEDNKLVFFDKDFNVAFEKPYCTDNEFKNDGKYLISIRGTKSEYVLDNKGKKYLCGEDYEILYGLGCGLFVVLKGKKYGVVDLEGRVVLPFEFDLVRQCSGTKDIVWTKKDGKIGFYRIVGD